MPNQDVAYQDHWYQRVNPVQVSVRKVYTKVRFNYIQGMVKVENVYIGKRVSEKVSDWDLTSYVTNFHVGKRKNEKKSLK